MFDANPPHSQSNLPVAASYPRMRFVPLTISCGLPPCSTTIGVAHDVCSSRSTFHRSSPVDLSSAMTHDLPSWSQLMNTKSPCSTGEDPSPCPCLVCISPNCFDHFSSPAVVRQKRPCEPKNANTFSPSVAAEFEARLPV